MKLQEHEIEAANSSGYMLFRQQRGSLADSMETIDVIFRTRYAVAAYARNLLRESQVYTEEQILTMTEDQIVCATYGRDERIGWDTYLLTSTNELMPVIGYCNKPLVD